MGMSISSLYYRFFGRQSLRFLMVGLEGAGKTTILFKLKVGEIFTSLPAPGFNVDIVEYKNISLISWDFSDFGRNFWPQYFQKTDGIIFVVDSNDRDKISKAKNELDSMLQSIELKNSALLIIANKQDLPTAMSVADLTDELGLNALGRRKWHLQPSSGCQGEGMYEGFDWLSKQLQ